jgi:DNA-binding YbaB/EbfC family protein
MKDMQRMLRQVQQVQADLERKQREATASFTANGITAVAKGDFTVESIAIAPEVLADADADMVADLVMIAVNGALGKVRQQLEGQLGNLAQGLNLPGLF